MLTRLSYPDQMIKLLGQGTFGKVVQARDKKKNELVAIKIIRNKKRFHHQALVEVKILDNLRKWVSVFDPASDCMPDHVHTRMPMRSTMLQR